MRPHVILIAIAALLIGVTIGQFTGAARAQRPIGEPLPLTPEMKQALINASVERLGKDVSAIKAYLKAQQDYDQRAFLRNDGPPGYSCGSYGFEPSIDLPMRVHANGLAGLSVDTRGLERDVLWHYNNCGKGGPNPAPPATP